MPLIRNGVVSLQSFVIGLGVLSYLAVYYSKFWVSQSSWLEFLIANPWCYLLGYFAVSNILVKLIYWGEEYMVALCGSFLGVVFGSGFIISVLNLYSLRIFGFYVLALSFFHYSEYFSTAATNPTSLSLDSYLLNHSISYWVAASASWIEFFLELWLCPSIKQLWYISAVGGVLCVFGEITRKVAMFTAERNFNHMVQVKRQSGHKLVTHGIYSFFRHPSYVGWFWWSIGTQVLLVNPVCAAFYTAASWTFFKERVRFEEMTLINFFDEEYINYQKSVPTGLPFIKGYLTESN